jgi:hypothetical protein
MRGQILTSNDRLAAAAWARIRWTEMIEHRPLELIAMSDRSALELEFSRALAAEAVPEEAPFFDELVSLKKNRSIRGDHDLGFGGQEALIGVVSLFLMDVGKTALSFVWQQVQVMVADLAVSATKEAETQLADKIKQWIKKRFAGPSPVHLSPAAVNDLLNTVRKAAADRGIGEPELTRITSTLEKAFTQS